MGVNRGKSGFVPELSFSIYCRLLLEGLNGVMAFTANG